jgi:hypothetical protein
MKNYFGFFLIFLCIVVIFAAGCTNAELTKPVPVAVSTPTPQIIYVTVTVTQTPTPSTVATTAPTINPTPKASSIYKEGDKIYINQPGDVISKYRVGDIIWETNTPYRRDLNGDMCVVIYAVDAVNKKYTIDYVWRDTGTTRWYREYPELDSFSIISIDRDYPYLIEHIDISKLASMFVSKAAYDTYYK